MGLVKAPWERHCCRLYSLTTFAPVSGKMSEIKNTCARRSDCQTESRSRRDCEIYSSCAECHIVLSLRFIVSLFLPLWMCPTAHNNEQYQTCRLKWLRDVYRWEMDTGLSSHCFHLPLLLGVKRKKEREEREMERNQSHLFVLRGDTLKRVAFLTIFLGRGLDVEARGSHPTCFDATLLRCHFREEFWGSLFWLIEFTVGISIENVARLVSGVRLKRLMLSIQTTGAFLEADLKLCFRLCDFTCTLDLNEHRGPLFQSVVKSLGGPTSCSQWIMSGNPAENIYKVWRVRASRLLANKCVG